MCHDIIKRGMMGAAEYKTHDKQHKQPLFYQWHDKEYLGAAHGYIGIFYVLLQVLITLFLFCPIFLAHLYSQCIYVFGVRWFDHLLTPV